MGGQRWVCRAGQEEEGMQGARLESVKRTALKIEQAPPSQTPKKSFSLDKGHL